MARGVSRGVNRALAVYLFGIGRRQFGISDIGLNTYNPPRFTEKLTTSAITFSLLSPTMPTTTRRPFRCIGPAFVTAFPPNSIWLGLTAAVTRTPTAPEAWRVAR